MDKAKLLSTPGTKDARRRTDDKWIGKNDQSLEVADREEVVDMLMSRRGAPNWRNVHTRDGVSRASSILCEDEWRAQCSS